MIIKFLKNSTFFKTIYLNFKTVEKVAKPLTTKCWQYLLIFCNISFLRLFFCIFVFLVLFDTFNPHWHGKINNMEKYMF